MEVKIKSEWERESIKLRVLLFLSYNVILIWIMTERRANGSPLGEHKKRNEVQR